jgi:hypothetical protein
MSKYFEVGKKYRDSIGRIYDVKKAPKRELNWIVIISEHALLIMFLRKQEKNFKKELQACKESK